MTGGVVTGGWEFVWAAYGITVAVLGGYVGTVLFRLRAEHQRSRGTGEGGEA
jgi:heme exporter protein CcmD